MEPRSLRGHGVLDLRVVFIFIFFKPLHHPQKCHILCPGSKPALSWYFKGLDVLCRLSAELGRHQDLIMAFLTDSMAALKRMASLGESAAGPHSAVDAVCSVTEPYSPCRMIHQPPWVTEGKSSTDFPPPARQLGPGVSPSQAGEAKVAASL